MRNCFSVLLRYCLLPVSVFAAAHGAVEQTENATWSSTFDPLQAQRVATRHVSTGQHVDQESRQHGKLDQHSNTKMAFSHDDEKDGHKEQCNTLMQGLELKYTDKDGVTSKLGVYDQVIPESEDLLRNAGQINQSITVLRKDYDDVPVTTRNKHPSGSAVSLVALSSGRSVSNNNTGRKAGWLADKSLRFMGHDEDPSNLEDIKSRVKRQTSLREASRSTLTELEQRNPKVSEEWTKGMIMPFQRRVRKKRREAIPKDLTNVALKKLAWMSSTYYPQQGPLTNGNDGNRQNNRFENCVHTLAGTYDHTPNRWWRVDLGGLYKIWYIDITNRADCCTARLRDFEINVAHTLDKKRAPRLADDQRCAFFKGSAGVQVRINCTKPVMGRFLTLFMKAQRDTVNKNIMAPLHFCELEAYGAAVTVSEAGYTCANDVPEKPAICKKGLTCISKSCRIHLGDPCDDTSKVQVCFPNTTCVKGKCRIPAGLPCNDTDKIKLCSPETTCINGKCRLNMGVSCAGNLSNECVETTVCDNLAVCRTAQGSPCVLSLNCVAGAYCDGICRCNLGLSVEDSSGKLCKPTTGRVTGVCFNKGRPCTDLNATCVEGKCQCKAKFRVNHRNYTCLPNATCRGDYDCGPGEQCDHPGLIHARCRPLIGAQKESAFKSHSIIWIVIGTAATTGIVIGTVCLLKRSRKQEGVNQRKDSEPLRRMSSRMSTGRAKPDAEMTSVVESTATSAMGTDSEQTRTDADYSSVVESEYTSTATSQATSQAPSQATSQSRLG